LTSLHVGQNVIPEKEMREIVAIAMRMEGMKILCEIPFKDKTLTEVDVSGKNLGLEGALVISDYLDGNGALLKFDISKNSLCAAGAKAILEGLKGNQVMTELNLGGNDMGKESPGMFGKPDMTGITALVDVIPEMGALSSLNLASNNIGLLSSEDGWTKSENGAYCSPEGKMQGATAPDGIEFKPMGIAALANAIEDMGALIKLDISSNNIKGEQEGELQRICVASGIELAK
jgi:hypothetical protein